MKHIAFTGGKIALDLISNRTYYLKPDKSVLTKADVEISRLARTAISNLLTTPDHILIDEEDTENTKYLDQSNLEAASFIWTIDPIDGTRAFSNGMPNFGISIGLLKDLRPWLGVVYFPMFGELFYSDGERSYFVKNAFREFGGKDAIAPINQQITRQSIFICNDSFHEKFEWHSSDCQLMNPVCAVLSLCWPTIGRGCGAFFGAHIWDFAGAWPIFLSAGLNLRSYWSGIEMKKIAPELFVKKGNDPWKLKEYYILSSERNYPLLREKITPKHQR